MKLGMIGMATAALLGLCVGGSTERAATPFVSQVPPVSVGQPNIQTSVVSKAGNGGQLPTSFLGGVIEGYYGTPWSTKDTIHMIAFISQHHMNTFVYAPKDDPYQRQQWDQLYPPDSLQQIKSLAQVCQQYHVQFVYSISPGLSITYGNDKDRAALVTKLNQLQSIGIHVFMISLDDIYHGLQGTDWNQYHGDMAFAQSSLINDLMAVESKNDARFRLILTPTHYHGMTDNGYWDSLRIHLNPSVPVVWTGPGPGALSSEITAADVKIVQKFIGHPLIIWDNYPVNDFTYTQSHHPQLFMGPVIGRSPDLVSAVAGYLYNPMLQARASELSLWTGGDYLYHPQTYQPEVSWQAAIRGLGGSAWPAFETFAEDSSTYYRDHSLPPQLETDMQAFWNVPKSGNLSKTALYHDWLNMSHVDAALQSGLPDAALYEELRPWSSLLSREGQVGALAVLMLEAHREGRPTADLARQVELRLHAVQEDANVMAADAASQFVTRALQQVEP